MRCQGELAWEQPCSLHQVAGSEASVLAAISKLNGLLFLDRPPIIDPPPKLQQHMCIFMKNHGREGIKKNQNSIAPYSLREPNLVPHTRLVPKTQSFYH